MPKQPNISNSNRPDALWAAFKNGDRAAFSVMFKKYYSDLYNYGLRLVNNEDLVREELQGLFVDIWVKRAGLGDVQHVKSYLLQSFRRKLIRTNETKRKNRLIPYLESSSQAEDALDRSGEQLLIDMEEQIAQNAQLNSAMKKLTENQREIIYLRFYSKLDYKEIAEITNLKYQSVRNTMYRAIKVLRAAFNVKK